MRRRTALASAGGLLASGVAGCLSLVSSGSENSKDNPPLTEDSIPAGTWPQIGYDAGHTRHIPQARGPRDDATVAWEQPCDQSIHPPVVADDLYLADIVESRTGDSTARAFAPDDGAEQWANTGLPSVGWAPALHGGRLFLITRAERNIVRLHALDAATGDHEWVQNDGITASSGENQPIAPTVHDDSIHIGSDRGIVACDVTTGDIKWTATLGPDIAEAETGEKWATTWAKPAVASGCAFTFDRNDNHGETREVYAVNARSGEREWTAELAVGDDWALRGPVVAGADHIFVSALKLVAVDTGGDDSSWSGKERLFALDITSGEIAWDWELPDTTMDPPAYADGTLYVGGWDPDTDTGRLDALDASDGSIIWTYETEIGGISAPTVAGDTVYIRQGTELTAVARDDKTRRWRLELGDYAGPPVVVGETVYTQMNPARDQESRLIAVREP